MVFFIFKHLSRAQRLAFKVKSCCPLVAVLDRFIQLACEKYHEHKYLHYFSTRNGKCGKKFFRQVASNNHKGG
jgi:hypothetical protein